MAIVTVNARNTITIIFIVSCSFLHSQQWEWARTDTSSFSQKALEIEGDSWGNILVTAQNYNGAFASHDQTISYQMLKYDSLGNLIWRHSFPWHPHNLSLDAANNIYCGSSFRDSIEVGSIKLVSKGQLDFFVVKLNSTGTIVWVKQFGNCGNDILRDLKVNKEGQIFVTGLFDKEESFCDSLVFDTITLHAPLGGGMFISQLNSDGTVQWANMGRQNAVLQEFHLQGNLLALDAEGKIYVLGEGTYCGEKCSQRFVAGFDTIGDITFLRTDEYFRYSYAYDFLALNNKTFIFLGDDHPRWTSDNGAFVTLCDSSLNPKWATQVRTYKVSQPDYWCDFANGLRISYAGDLYLAGHYGKQSETAPTISIYDYNLPKRGGETDIGIMHIPIKKNGSWLMSAGGVGTEFAQDLYVSSSGASYLIGEYFSNEPAHHISFGNDSFPYQVSPMLFVAKLNQPHATVDMPSLASPKLSIWPNPSDGIMQVNGIKGKYTYKVYGTTGAVLCAGSEENTAQGRLNIQQLGPGVYNLQIETRERMVQARIVLR